jgi:hypothetical protein
MQVYIGPYRSWVGPYQIAEMILFWMDKYKDDRVHKFGEWLNKVPGLAKFCTWIDSFKKRKVKIKIHGYDTWSMDGTLALIILPMLKHLKDNQHGAGHVDDEDVPEHIRSTAAPKKENEHDTDFFWFRRWEWVLDEMIWTFEQLQPDCDWEDQYYSGVVDVKWIDSVDHPKYKEMVHGPNHTHTLDKEGYEKHSNRIKNGLMLFGKYYRSLWS